MGTEPAVRLHPQVVRAEYRWTITEILCLRSGFCFWVHWLFYSVVLCDSTGENKEDLSRIPKRLLSFLRIFWPLPSPEKKKNTTKEKNSRRQLVLFQALAKECTNLVWTGMCVSRSGLGMQINAFRPSWKSTCARKLLWNGKIKTTRMWIALWKKNPEKVPLEWQKWFCKVLWVWKTRFSGVTCCWNGK